MYNLSGSTGTWSQSQFSNPSPPNIGQFLKAATVGGYAYFAGAFTGSKTYDLLHMLFPVGVIFGAGVVNIFDSRLNRWFSSQPPSYIVRRGMAATSVRNLAFFAGGDTSFSGLGVVSFILADICRILRICVY